MSVLYTMNGRQQCTPKCLYCTPWMVGSSVHQNVCTCTPNYTVSHIDIPSNLTGFFSLAPCSQSPPPAVCLRPDGAPCLSQCRHVRWCHCIFNYCVTPPLLAICTSPYMFSLYLFLSPLDLCPPRGDLVTYPVRGGAARGTSCGPSSICSTSGRDSQ